MTSHAERIQILLAKGPMAAQQLLKAVGMARSPWPVVTATLAAAGLIDPEAHESAALLYAFGTLIGNTDMHHSNLSFISAVCALH